MVLAAKALVLSAILAVISCGPIDVRLASEDKCYTTCTESNKFNYLPGRTYQFQYEGETVTTTQSNEHSSLHFRATADIEAISKCEMALTLSDVSVEESDPRDLARRFRSEGEAALKEALESSALRFSFQDGQIAELCPEREESQMALNIKRGILSAFQNNMESLERDHSGSETDVAGNCPADYIVTENSWDKIVVTKSKNLVGCTERHNYGNAFQGVAYKVDSDIQSLPLMKSTHDCEQTFHRQGRLIASKCQESHVFRPFNDEKTSSNTTTSQSLTFVREHNGPRTRGPITRRTDMLFEHSEDDEQTEKDISAAQYKLREICQATSSEVRPETPRLFTELVYIIRKLNNFGLKNLHRIASTGKPCQQAKKYFFDALPMAGSSSSIKLMKNLLIDGEITGLEADAWMTAMAFVQNPTQEMIDELQDIVSSPKTSKKAMLPVSTMIYNFCKNNGNCKSNGAVREIIRIFEQNLNGDCRFNNAEEREKVLLSLRAIGNAGQSVNAIALLNRCFMGRNSMDIRVAAIDAFRRMDCSESRTEAMDLFKNTEEDSELRIGAYLVVMQCPTVDTIEEVKNVLEREEINQVGSFVWTHLTNLMETSDPHKQNIRAILEDATLKKEFDMDKRKFSRNIELSFFSEMLNTGAKADSNLIWSTKSWIPRSAMLNMTVDLFGSQINLLEIGGRVEGMDYLLESLFGNNGYFPEMADTIRNKRSARDGMLNRFKQSYQIEDASEPKASMFMRIFGNEMAFMDLTNSKGSTGGLNFLDILIKLAENHKVDFTKSIIFLDAHYKIPTIIGMPLVLDVNGTATVDVKVGGKMDLRQLGSSPRSVDIDGYMQPSTAVEISSSMYVDCGVAKTGVASIATMHSSADVEGTISLKNGEVFVTKVKMPKDKINILSVDNKFFVYRKSVAVEQRMADKKSETTKCTGDMIAKITGLELCAAHSYTTTAPITGPSSLKVSLNKRDTHSSYEFTTTFMAKKSKTGSKSVTNIASVAFDTPGSKVDREMSVNFQLNRGEKTVNFDMKSPWKKVSAKGSIDIAKILKKVSTSIVVDSKQEYSAVAQMKVYKKGLLTTYSPSVVINIDKMDPITLKGTLQNKNFKKMTADIAINNLFKSPVTFKGDMLRLISGANANIKSNMAFKSSFLDATLKSSAFKKKTNYKSNVQVLYQFNNQKQQKVTFSGKFQDKSLKNLARFIINNNFVSTQFPGANYVLTANVLKKNTRLENTVTLGFGKAFKSPKNRIVFSQVLSNTLKGRVRNVDHTMKFLLPSKDINMNSKVSVTMDPRNLKTIASIEYKPKKVVTLSADLKNESKKLRKYSGEISLTTPRREMRFTESLQEQEPMKFSNQMLMQWQKDSQAKMVTSFAKVGKKEYMLDSTLQVPTFDTINFSGRTKLIADDFNTNAEVTYEGKKYSAGVNYKYEGQGKQLSGEGHIEAAHPSRRVITDGSFKFIAGNTIQSQIETKWDADRDENKKAGYEVDYKIVGTKHEGAMKVYYPRREVNLAMNVEKKGEKYTSHAEASWEAGKKMQLDSEMTYSNRGSRSFQGSTRFTSPFEKFENIYLSATHQDNGQQYNSNAEFSWAPRSKVQGSLTGKFNSLMDLDGTVSLFTPLSRSPIVLRQKHAITRKQATSHTEFEYSNKKTIVDMSGKDDSNRWKSDIEGSFSLTTPCKYFNTLEMKFDHTMTRKMIKVSGEVSKDNKVIGATIKGVADVSSNARDVEGTFELKTPFSKLENILVSASHKDDSRKYNTDLKVRWAPKQEVAATMEMTGAMRGYSIRSNGKLEVTTPFTPYESTTLNWNHDNSETTIRHNSDLTWARRNKIVLGVDGSVEIGAETKINGLIKLRTPIRRISDVSIGIAHSHDADNLKSELTGSYPYNKNVKLTVDLSKATDVQGSITFSSPYTNMKNLAASFITKTSRRPFTTHAEVSWTPEDKIAFDGNVNYYGLRYLTGDARITTPFAGFETMSVSINHSKRDEWSTAVEVEYAPRMKYSFEGKLNTDMPKGSLNIRTPTRILRSMTASFEHSGNFPYFNTKSNMKLIGTYPTSIDAIIRVSGTDKINGNIQLDLPQMDKISIDLTHRQQGSKYTTEASASAASSEVKLTSTLNIPSINNIDGSVVGSFKGEELKINFNHDGYLKNFRNHLDVSIGNKNVNLDGRFSMREMTGDFKIQSNIPQIRFANIKFNHDGDFTGFKHHAEVSFNSDKMEYDGSFTSSPKVEGTFTLKNAKNNKEVTLTFDHQGSLTRFTNNAKLSIAGDDIEYTGSFANTNRVVGRFTLTDSNNDIRLIFNHNGDLSQFKSSAKFLKNNKGYEADIEFDSVPMKGQATLNTPYTKTAAAAFNFNGEPMNFNTHGEVSYGPKKIEGDATFSKQFGNFVLKTPFSTLSEVKYSYTIEGSVPKYQFTAHSEFSYNGGNNIIMNTEVSWMKKISTDLTTPFAAIRNLNAEVTKKGNKVHAELTHNRRNKFETDLTLDMNSFKKGDLTIETPFQALNSLNIAYNHEGDLRDFQSHAELTHNRRNKFEIDATSRLTSADVTIKTPFDTVRVLNVAYSHIGGLWNFKSHAELTHNQRNKFTVDASNNNFETTEFAFTTPFRTLSDAKLTVKQEGTLDDYTSSTEFTYNRANNIKADVVFASTKDIKGSMTVTTTFPVLRDLKVAFNHAGRFGNFKSDGEITWNRRNTIAGDLEVVLSRNTKINAGLTTPFTKDLKVVYTFKGDLQNFVEHLEVSYPSVILQTDTEFQLSPLSLKLKQAMPNFNFDGQLSHTGDYRRFQTHAEGKVNNFEPVVADLSFNMIGKVEGALKVQNQWVPIDISFNHVGSIDNFKCNGEAIVNNKKYDGLLELSNDRVTEGKLVINTPHRQLYNVEAAFNTKGHSKNMRGHAELSYNGGNKMEADASFKNYRNIQAEASIKTPFRQVREASASFKHEGNMLNFKSGAEVTYNRRNKINADVDFTTEGVIRGNAVVTTPFQNFERTAVSFNSEDKKSHGEVFAYNKKIEADVEHKGFKNVKAIIKTPFAGYETMEAAYLIDGQLANGNAHAEVSKNNKKIEADLSIDSSRGYSGKATIKTPFPGYEEMSATIDHTGSFKRFRSSATVQLSPRAKYTTFADFTLNRNMLNAVAKMSSPSYQLDTNVKHEGDMHDFKTSCMVNYNGAITSLEGAYKDLYNVPAEGSIKFSCPYVEDMSLMFTNAKRGDKYNMHSELSWNPRSKIVIDSEMKYNGLNDMDASVKVMTPFRSARQFGFDLEHMNSGYNFNTKLSTEFNNEKRFSGSAGYRKVGDSYTAELATEVPHPMSYKGSFMNTETTTSISGEANLNSKVRGNTYKGSFNCNKEDSRRILKSSMEARTETPYRVMSFKTDMNKSPYNFKHSAEMSWDEARNKKVSYDIDFKDRSRRSSRNYDLTAKLATPIRTMQLQGRHSDNGATFNSNADLMWDMIRDPSKKLSVRGSMEIAIDTFKAEAGINAPSLPKEITLNVENMMNQRRNILSHKSVLSYSRNPSEDWTVSGLVQDTGANNYTAEFGLTHPRSNLDVVVGGHLANNQYSKSIGCNMKYLDSRRQMQKVWGYGYFDGKTVRVDFYAPKVARQLMSASQTGNGFQIMHSFYDGKPSTADFTFDPETKAFDLKVKYGTAYPQDLFHMYGKYVNDKHVMVEAYRMDNNRKITEGSVSLRMNNSRLAHGRLYWRPSMYWDIKENLPAQISQLRAQIARQWEEVQSDVSNEIRSKTHHVTYSMPDMSPVSDYISNEISQFNNDAETAMDAVNMMYRRNEFYSRDAVDTGVAAVAYTKDMARDFSAKMDEMKRTAQATMDQYRYMAERMYNDYYRRAVYQYRLAQYNFNRKYNEYAPVVQRYIDQGYDMIAPYYQTLETRARRHRRDLSGILDSITGHPHYKTTMEKIGDFYSQTMSHMKTIKNKAADLKEAADKHIKLTKAKMNGMYNDALDAVNQKLNDAMGHDAVVYTKKVALNALDMAKDAADFINVKKNFNKIARDIYRNSKNVATKHAAFVTDIYKNVNKNKVTVFNPKQGEIQAQAYLPFDMKDLKTLPKIDTSMLEKLKDLTWESLPSMPKYNPMDDYYHYKPASSNPLDWIPPFKASAYVVGAQHIKTFDGTYFEFASPCSYVLTQDFSNDNFTVVGNFEGDTKHISKESLMVISNDKKIEIFSDFKVLVDGKKTELPFEFENTSVSIEGEMVFVKSALGLTVVWDRTNDIWGVEISGWYFGKVAGLLGTYDNEQSNDFTTSRKTVEELERFTTSWEASGACRVRGNQARDVVPQEHRRSFKECARLFKEEASFFRPCYKQVSPQKYFRMCVNDIEGFERDACKMAAAYIKECAAAGIPKMPMPEACSTCNSESKRLSNIPQSADVVLVVEERQCNKDLTGKLGALVERIEMQLRELGLSNNRFGIVGFGGEGVHNKPHTHTVGGEIMGDARRFSFGTANLDFEEDGEFKDTLGAIEKAARYPFRQGVSKTIVLVTCTECTQQKTQYNDILNMLTARDITLHMLADSEFELKSESKSPKIFVFGVDGQSAYNRKSLGGKKLRGDKELFSQLVVPQHICADLTTQTEGSLFDLNRLTAGNVQAQKSFSEAFGKRVAMSAIPSGCQECSCTEGETVCKTCTSQSTLGKMDENPYADEFKPMPSEDDEFRNELKEYLRKPMKVRSMRRKA